MEAFGRLGFFFYFNVNLGSDNMYFYRDKNLKLLKSREQVLT